jgi:hypothetical protein
VPRWRCLRFRSPRRPANSSGSAGNFPVIHAAIEELRRTKASLQTDAASDFHSHKVNAINHIDAAIQELKAGIQEDRKH